MNRVVWRSRCPRCGYRELRKEEFLCDPCKKLVREKSENEL